MRFSLCLKELVGASISLWYSAGRQGSSQLLLPSGILREDSMEEVASGCLGMREGIGSCEVKVERTVCAALGR